MKAPFDALWLLDDKDNISNEIGVCFFEPFQFDKMKEHMLLKSETVHKCRSKLVMKFGLWFFKKMGSDEWELKKDSVFVLKQGIHTNEDLCAFLCRE